MADHGLTGTHHIDGTPCTMTPECPWTQPAPLTPQQAAALSASISIQMAQGATLPPWCECCERSIVTPYHHDNHNPPYDGYDYCQECHDAGCGDPNDPPCLVAQQVSPGGPMTIPITPQMLRDDWPDHPDLSESDKLILGSLTDPQLSEALEEAGAGYENTWFQMLDEVRGTATRRLLASVPSADNAPDGTSDECVNCGLPITRQDGEWQDLFMSNPVCMSGGDGNNPATHSPKAVLAAYMKALQEGGKKQQTSTPGVGNPQGPLLYCLTKDGGDREDGNVYYVSYVIFFEPESSRGAIDADLVALLGGQYDGPGEVSFQGGLNSLADEFHDDSNKLAQELQKKGWKAQALHSSFITRNE